jgi:hypothetical protein
VASETADETASREDETANSEKAAGKERRRRMRFICDGIAETVVIQGECLFRGKVRDISETGCYIVTRACLHLERSTLVNIRFMVNDNYYRTFARVMDVRPGQGVGVEFLFADLKAEAALKGLISMLDAVASKKQAKAAESH